MTCRTAWLAGPGLGPTGKARAGAVGRGRREPLGAGGSGAGGARDGSGPAGLSARGRQVLGQLRLYCFLPVAVLLTVTLSGQTLWAQALLGLRREGRGGPSRGPGTMSPTPHSPRPGLTVDGHLQGLVELHAPRGPLRLGPVAVASSQDGGRALLVTLLGRGWGAGGAGSSERLPPSPQGPEAGCPPGSRPLCWSEQPHWGGPDRAPCRPALHPSPSLGGRPALPRSSHDPMPRTWSVPAQAHISRQGRRAMIIFT